MIFHQHRLDIVCVKCVKDKCENYEKLLEFAKWAARHEEDEYCISCGAADILKEIGELKE
jgi:hypothetical protein